MKNAWTLGFLVLGMTTFGCTDVAVPDVEALDCNDDGTRCALAADRDIDENSAEVLGVRVETDVSSVLDFVDGKELPYLRFADNSDLDDRAEDDESILSPVTEFLYPDSDQSPCAYMIMNPQGEVLCLADIVVIEMPNVFDTLFCIYDEDACYEYEN